MRPIHLALVVAAPVVMACSSSETSSDVERGQVIAAPPPTGPTAPAASAPLVPSGALAEECRTAEIVELARPLTSSAPERGSFTYRVRYRKPAQPGLPTIVHLPGGPGMPSIGSEAAFVPETYGLVQTDPRGVGCNVLARVDDPATFFRSEEKADDVISAIAKLGLADYVIHGHSYGTVLATHVAHRLASGEAPKPRVVILEGVLGRAFTTEWMGQSYLDEWTHHKAKLHPSVLELLREPAPLGFDGQAWGTLFLALTSQYGEKDTRDTFSLLAANDAGDRDPANVERVKQTITQFKDALHSTEETAQCQRFVACREISSDVPATNIDVVLRDGDFVRSPDVGSLCTGLQVERPYHVRDLQYPFKTVYFLGEHDSATPAWQGKLHFDNLVTADRVEIVVKGGGHLPLMLHLAQCAPGIVSKIASGAPFAGELAACNVPVETRTATAQAR